MQNVIRFILAGAIVWATALGADSSVVVADSSVVVEGYVDWVELDHLMLGSQRYDVIYAATEKGKADAETYGFETECWEVISSFDRYRIDYITLVKVGYADHVRLTLENGVVRTIEIIELYQ
jgi:hypothetical protein